MAVFFRRGHAVSTPRLKAQDVSEQQTEVVYPQGLLAGSQYEQQAQYPQHSPASGIAYVAVYPRRPQGTQHVRTLAIQLPEEILRRLDAYIGQVPAANPSLRLSRTNVLRLLLDKGPRLDENSDIASDRRAEAGKPGPCQTAGVME